MENNFDADKIPSEREELFSCNRCSHEWKPRIKNGEVPKYCPKCKNPYWNKPRIREKRGVKSKKRIAFSILGVFALIFVVVAAEKIMTSQPAIIILSSNNEILGDAYVAKYSPDTNFGAYEQLYIHDDALLPRRSYLKFNLSYLPSNTTIVKAILNLFSPGFSDADNEVLIYNVFDNTWDEKTITWNNQPCGTKFDNSQKCNLTYEDAANGTSTKGWVALSVTDMVNRSYSNGDVTISVAIKTPETHYHLGIIPSFWSKEFEGNMGTVQLKPYLAITYGTEESSIVYFSSCRSLDMPNTTYYLVSDIMYSPAWICMAVTADNVTLDCQGHTIDGGMLTRIWNGEVEIGGYAGVYVYRPKSTDSHITIRNCTISGWQDGISLTRAMLNNISHVNSSSNSEYGIWLRLASSNIIEDSNFKENGNLDIFTEAWNDKFYCNNTFTNVTAAKTIFCDADNSTITSIEG